MAYDVRSLILINEGYLNTYKSYTTASDFNEQLKSDIEEALNNIYDI